MLERTEKPFSAERGNVLKSFVHRLGLAMANPVKPVWAGFFQGVKRFLRKKGY
jgi:hypothetical protein